MDYLFNYFFSEALLKPAPAGGMAAEGDSFKELAGGYGHTLRIHSFTSL